MKLSKLFAIIIVTSLSLSSCSSQSSTSTSPASSAPPKVRPASEVPWIDPNGSNSRFPPGIDEGETFNTVLTAFEGIGCKRDNQKRGIYSVPDSLYSITGYPIYLNRYYNEFSWGTSSEQLKVSLASMAWSLAEIEDTVKYLESKSRSQDFRTWNSLFKKWTELACGETSLPEAEAYKVLMDFLGSYEDFFYWRNEVFDQSNEEYEAFTESLKPQCQEYPSSNPKYSIVKCTNLP